MISNSAINANIEQMLKNFEDQVKEDIDLEKLSPRQLKASLAAHQLPVDGDKHELVSRLALAMLS